MSRVWIVILLLLGSNPGQGCAAAAVDACFSACHGINTAHRDAGPHNSVPCNMGSCRPHEDRLLTRASSSDFRNERRLLDKPRAFTSHPITTPTAASFVAIRKGVLFFPHPFPEASPPPFMIKCAFLC